MEDRPSTTLDLRQIYACGQESCYDGLIIIVFELLQSDTSSFKSLEGGPML